MKQRYFVIGLMLWLMAMSIQAQEPALKAFMSVQLRKNCTEAISVDKAKYVYESVEVFKKLGDMHYFNKNHEEASKWYTKLYRANNGIIKPEYLLKYSMALKAIGNEILAAKINNEFMNISENISLVFPSSLDALGSIRGNPHQQEVKFLPIPIGGDDRLVENEFEDVSDYNYYGRKRWGSGQKKPRTNGANNNRGSTNVNLHESSVAMTKDGSAMYFTRPYIMVNMVDSGQAQLRIYRAHRANDSWVDIEDLSINGADYSNAQPVLSLDEKTLYFSSDMPSSYGKTDIYAVAINDNGSLGTPRNLGPKVNTRRNESFPFVSSNNGLYFSSDGHYGNGGFDVYYADLENKDKKLLNLGKSINGPYDDLTLPRFGRFGLKTYSHASGNTKTIQGFFYMKITVTLLDYTTGKPINGVRVQLIDDGEVEKIVLETDRKGSCTFNINRFKAYMLKVENEKYENTYKYIAKGNSNRGLRLRLKRSKL